jgi:hypothetical protein
VSIRRIKIRGQWRYQARVAVQGQRASRVCATREAAGQAEAELLQTVKTRATAQTCAPRRIRD